MLTMTPEKPLTLKKILSTTNDLETQQRLSVLTTSQITKLSDVMNEEICIQGKNNFPNLKILLRDFLIKVRDKLEKFQSMPVRDVRLNGGAASHVLAEEDLVYNDLDLIFSVDFSSGKNFEKVRQAVLDTLYDMLPQEFDKTRVFACCLKEAYLSKMVKVNYDGDRWSLFSLSGDKNVELKFVDTTKREYEFSVDSFQIVLDSLLVFYELKEYDLTEEFYPTVVVESVYGDYPRALHHLNNKLIITRRPEEIRGGGLLKFCNLLVKNYQPAWPDCTITLQKYMCSRFFIDFPELDQQRFQIENYLLNHFHEKKVMHKYLTCLRAVIKESSVCLMEYVKRRTLRVIDEITAKVLHHKTEEIHGEVYRKPSFIYYGINNNMPPTLNGYNHLCMCMSWIPFPR